MAHVRRATFWATRSLGVLVIFLFSAMHLTPPAWAKAVGDKDRQTDLINEVELTSLIADLGQNVWFDDRLEEELQRLRGTAATSQNLAQTAPQPKDPVDLLPLEELAPRAKDLMQQAPPAKDLMQQAPNADLLYGGTTDLLYGGTAEGRISKQVPSVQPMQAPNADLFYGGPTTLSPTAKPAERGISKQVPSVQPMQAPSVRPQQTPSVKLKRVPTIQPQQIQKAQPQHRKKSR